MVDDDIELDARVSIGVAELTDLDTSLRVADDNLMLAKTGGRNRVVG